jgi:MFS family permease
MLPPPWTSRLPAPRPAGRTSESGRPVTRIAKVAVVDAETAAACLQPRTSLVAERAVGDGSFERLAGPVDDYRREVLAVELPDGRTEVSQTVTYSLRIPYFGFLFAIGFRSALGAIGPERSRWWAPPERLDGESAAILAVLSALSMVTGYLSTLLTQTITFSAQEFHAGKTAQGIALGVVRADILLSLGLVVLADRWGRRTIAVRAAVLGSLLTAAGALSPSLPTLVASQVIARGFVTAVTISVSVLAVEAMPKGGRAYALGLIAMASALGVGVAVVSLPVADLGIGGWRILFGAGLLGVPVSLALGRRLPESRRFTSLTARAARGARASQPPAAAPPAQAPARGPAPVIGGWRSRLALLSVATFCFNLFVVPASQFQNEYLRHQRHFSAARISVFIIVTVVPGAIGIFAGGRLADTRGRRRVGSAAAAGGALAGVLFYATAGWPMWVASTIASIVGSAVVPALSVYGPELFPTHNRGTANGLINLAGRAGSVVGLVGAGLLSSALGFGQAFALLAIGPAVVAVLVLARFPETTRRELEELNPEDWREALA